MMRSTTRAPRFDDTDRGVRPPGSTRSLPTADSRHRREKLHQATALRIERTALEGSSRQEHPHGRRDLSRRLAPPSPKRHQDDACSRRRRARRATRHLRRASSWNHQSLTTEQEESDPRVVERRQRRGRGPPRPDVAGPNDTSTPSALVPPVRAAGDYGEIVRPRTRRAGVKPSPLDGDHLHRRTHDEPC